MFIQTESTPNPETLKFLPDQAVLDHGTASFGHPDEADQSPLAGRIFAVEGVAGVFLGRDFIAVTRAPNTDWQPLKPLLLAAIMQHYASGEPAVSAPVEPGTAAEVRPEDAEVVAEIRDLIDTRVRPAVAGHGGDIVFHGYRDGVVMLELHGACSGCPSSMTTLKMGVENMLRHYIPAVQEVREVA
ncbi:MAG: NifU family protein [Rhodospirillales bacterium]|nr:NifU family protein [Rhodospirillales bacterium]